MTPDTFKQTILKLQPDMQRYAKGLLGDADAAADAVQDAVIDMWQHRERLENVVNVKGYCITMVKRRCIDQLRNMHPSTPIDEETLHDAVQRSFCDLEDNVFRPILTPLSENDRAFLAAMAQDETVTKTSL